MVAHHRLCKCHGLAATTVHLVRAHEVSVRHSQFQTEAQTLAREGTPSIFCSAQSLYFACYLHTTRTRAIGCIGCQSCHCFGQFLHFIQLTIMEVLDTTTTCLNHTQSLFLGSRATDLKWTPQRPSWKSLPRIHHLLKLFEPRHP